MATSEFRAHFDGSPASRDQLDQIEAITVDQEIDMAWEARLEIPILTKGDGVWSGTDQSFAGSFTRIRIEIRIGKGTFVPLIDGPVVGADTTMSSQPGRSSQTVIVQDDSVYLNRTADIKRFDGQRDDEVAHDLLSAVTQIARVEVETTPASGTSRKRSVVQRGTAMTLLRRLGRPQDKHAYVLPGDRPGQSIGAFKSLRTDTDGLPELVLLGERRNVVEFHVNGNWQQPSTVRAFSLDVGDKSVTEATSSFRDVQLLGARAALASESDAATRLARPGADDTVAPQQRVQAAANRDSYALTARGSVLADCYPGVLTPYRVVSVRGVDAKLSGNYMIKRVTHRLTRSSYTQSFELLRNAVAQAGNASTAPALPRIS